MTILHGINVHVILLLLLLILLLFFVYLTVFINVMLARLVIIKNCIACVLWTIIISSQQRRRKKSARTNSENRHVFHAINIEGKFLIYKQKKKFHIKISRSGRTFIARFDANQAKLYKIKSFTSNICIDGFKDFQQFSKGYHSFRFDYIYITG